MKRWTVVSVWAAVLALVVSGCGSGGGNANADDERLTSAAIESITTYLDGQGRSVFDVPFSGFVEQDAQSRIEKIQATRRADGELTGALVQAEAVTSVKIKPRTAAASMFRVLPPDGVTIEVRRAASVQLFDADGTWQPTDGSVKVSEPIKVTLSEAELTQPQELAKRAATALFTFTGDMVAYNRAQADFYATRGGVPGIAERSATVSDVEFHLDPPPTLVPEVRPTVRGRLIVQYGAGWQRPYPPDWENGDKQNDVPLLHVLGDEQFRPSCERFALERMQPVNLTVDKISGQRLDVWEMADVRGVATVTASRWEDCGDYSGSRATPTSPERAGTATLGPQAVRLLYGMRLARFNGTPDWFIVSASVSQIHGFYSPMLNKTVYDTPS